MDYIIRKLEKKDLGTLIKLCQNHAEYEQANYSSIEKEIRLKSAIFSKNPKLYCYVIESGTELTGYFSFTFDFSTWDAQTFLYLDCLYLEPNFRGLKIGEQIFEKLKQIGQENNCVNIQWQTPTFNERAIKFYKRIGGFGNEKIRFFIDTAK
jgi:ribosomal protein S18 acetylase RimI-like enzyme